MINTKCEKCIFKITDANHQQTGCEFDVDNIIQNNYIDIYGNNSIKKNNQYWIIENFKCIFGRNESWLKSYQEFFGESNGIKQYVLDQTNIAYYAVLLCNGSFEQFTQSMDILNDSKNRPKFLSVILPVNKQEEQKKYTQYLNNLKLYKWKLHKILDPETTDAEMIDVAVTTNYENSLSDYLIIKYTLPSTTEYYYDRINELVNFCIGKKIVIIPNAKDNFDGLAIPLSLYKVYNNAIGILYNDILNDDSVHKIKLI